jgi:hypothetical protein
MPNESQTVTPVVQWVAVPADEDKYLDVLGAIYGESKEQVLQDAKDQATDDYYRDPVDFLMHTSGYGFNVYSGCNGRWLMQYFLFQVRNGAILDADAPICCSDGCCRLCATPVDDEQEALRRLYAGERWSCSTGICGSMTYGFGRLDYLGYFEYPLYFDPNVLLAL